MQMLRLIEPVLNDWLKSPNASLMRQRKEQKKLKEMSTKSFVSTVKQCLKQSLKKKSKLAFKTDNIA